MTRICRLSALLLAFAVSAVTPAFADSYLVYGDGGIPGNGTDVWTWCASGQPCDFAEIAECDTPEGSRKFRQRGIDPWMGFGVFHNIDPGPDGLPGTGDEFATPVDLSAFLGGEVRAFIRSPFDLNLEMQCQVGGQNRGGFLLLSDTNWDGTDTWQEITIPLSAYEFGNPPINMADCLGAVLSPWMSTAANLPLALNTFFVDYVRWHLPNSHPGPSSVQVQGRQLVVNGEPFALNAVAYSPISIGEDFHGVLRDRPDRYLVDFPLIADSGANAVRIYSTFMTTAMLDAAWANGLYVIPTFGIDAIQNSCAAGRSFMQDRMRDMVLEHKDHPAILFWMVGNEFNRGLTTTELCDPTTGWYPQLDALALEAHLAEGPSFHPVATGNSDTAGLSDICDPGCSDDTALPNLDIWGVQVYRGCSFGTLFADYEAKVDCEKPLIITEFGADAWDSNPGVEDEIMQANCIESLLDEADQALAIRTAGGVSAGQVLFEWADEWWKAFALDPPQAGLCSAADATSWLTHDTCASWENFAYPDSAMNEEWWGITSLSDSDPDARVLRAAHVPLGESWHLGDVCNMDVVSYDAVSGATTISFDPAPGSTDHTLYYGPMNSVSSYGYSGSVSGLGADGSGSLTLPAGPLFWLVVGRDEGAEGGYDGGEGTGRPPSPDSAVPQDPNRTGLCR